MKGILFVAFFVAFVFQSVAQTDTIIATDTTGTNQQQPTVRRSVTRATKDSNRVVSRVTRDTTGKSIPDTAQRLDTATIATIVPSKPFDPFYSRFMNHPYLPIGQEPIYRIANERKRWSKDELFYAVAGLIMFLALSRLVFNKYFKNIFRLFFQPSFRQKQTREQLVQSNLPSLVFNLFFVASAAIYVTLLLQHYALLKLNFWLLFAYCAAVLGILYISKFLFVSFSGWVFNVKEAADTYIFIVYLINKIVGVVLVPFILVIAFSQLTVINVCITISFLVLVSLYVYRYVVSYAPISKEVKVSPFHFLFYILAFEIVPLLLIYKLLMLYLARTH
ncbi:DUF4271 domain-containing protein [Segetibacter sp. 3557_3]|uniref:DUF4271 domain-containing protein n=1 Tax=Segetibacter sp. 3557_3 TaxID=2547429 RepID=UPI001058E96B|nr:DUF4271 domain-containing protein [Segetibacter sp. 3557_3]TDH19794.1 DUF4271 domain-containing protein [Segetibacter sp. 3557_3]